jgi:hypothetical protein
MSVKVVEIGLIVDLRILGVRVLVILTSKKMVLRFCLKDIIRINSGNLGHLSLFRE